MKCTKGVNSEVSDADKGVPIMYLSKLYEHNLTLLTDLYQITMAQGYWKQDRENEEAVFHHFFRENPFGGGYAIAAGIHTFCDYLENFGFDEGDLEYLRTLKGNDGEPMFDDEFLQYLSEMELDVDIDAVREGEMVFPHEPLVRVKGPLIQCQLLETALLNIVNFQTLIATKASRICEAARGEPVLEFGLRRAQGIDGGIMAARAAYIGGCVGTSNVLAGKLLDIPVKGTHAHSWVMSYESEMQSFREYAEAMPNNCIFLVDTYDTIEGVKKAVKVGADLRKQGHEMVGIRLDSGDLADLSKKARKILDEAGFPEAKIVASNGLDEYKINRLKDEDAKITVWGVGTNLATAKDQPALGGVYKLAAIKRDTDQPWEPCIKLSEQKIKISNPGCLQVKRFFGNDGTPVGDMIINEMNDGNPGRTITDPMDGSTTDFGEPWETLQMDLLQPVYRKGRIAIVDFKRRTLNDMRDYANGNSFGKNIRHFDDPDKYPVGLSKALHKQRQEMIESRTQDTEEKI